MKKITTTMLILMVSICIKAQSLKNKLDSVFMNVNKSAITTGLLDYSGSRIYNLGKLTGQASDTAVINFYNWRDVYTGLATAYISNTYKLPTAAASYMPLINNQNENSNNYLYLLISR